MKKTKIQTKKVIKVQEFQGEFGEMQRRFRIEEGLEWRRRSLGFKHKNYPHKPTPPKIPHISEIL